MQAVRQLVPQRLRLRAWLLGQRLTPGAFRLRRAQPSLRQRLAAKAELGRRGRRAHGGGAARLDGACVINLESRPDRLEQARSELDRLELGQAERFDAIADDNRALGCSLSHAGCVRLMLERDWKSVLVCEDDVEFLVDRPALDVLVDEFLDDPRAEVACFAYFVWESRPYSRLFLRGLSVQTASCYVVKRSIAPALLDVWENGIEKLRRGGTPALHIADRSWMRLQHDRVFLVPMIRAARQRAGYSDIQHRVVAYGH